MTSQNFQAPGIVIFRLHRNSLHKLSQYLVAKTIQAWLPVVHSRIHFVSHPGIGLQIGQGFDNHSMLICNTHILYQKYINIYFVYIHIHPCIVLLFVKYILDLKKQLFVTFHLKPFFCNHWHWCLIFFSVLIYLKWNWWSK